MDNPQVIEEGGVRFELMGESDPNGEPVQPTPEEPSVESPKGDKQGTQPPVSIEEESKEDAPAVAEEPAPTEEPTEEPTQEAWTDAEKEALSRLEAYEREAREQAVRAATRPLDQRISKLVEENKAAMAQMKAALREAQEKGLSDEEREALHKKWADEDKRSELDEYRELLDAQHRDLQIAALLMRYEQYGVKEEDLDEIEDISEMESFCKDAKIAYMENQLNGKEQLGGPQVTPAGGVTKQEQPPKEEPKKPAPAGASAPSDVGGGGPAEDANKEFKTGQGREDMLHNWQNLPAQRVRFG